GARHVPSVEAHAILGRGARVLERKSVVSRSCLQAARGIVDKGALDGASAAGQERERGDESPHADILAEQTEERTAGGTRGRPTRMGGTRGLLVAILVVAAALAPARASALCAVEGRLEAIRLSVDDAIAFVLHVRQPRSVAPNAFHIERP